MRQGVRENISRLWLVVSHVIPISLHVTIVEEMLEKVVNSGTMPQYHEMLAQLDVSLPDNILQIIGDLRAQANKTFVLSPQ
jgi:hypothetical protein